LEAAAAAFVGPAAWVLSLAPTSGEVGVTEGLAGADVSAEADSAPLNDNISESSSRRVSYTIGRFRETFCASCGGAVASAAEGAMSFAAPASIPGSTMGGGALRGQFRKTIAGMTTPAASVTTSALLRRANCRLALEAAMAAVLSGARLSSVSFPCSARGNFASSALGVDDFVAGGHARDNSFANAVFDFTLAL
jgi:hypothetical protein